MNEEQRELVERAREVQRRVWKALEERLKGSEMALLRGHDGLRIHCNVLEGYYLGGKAWEEDEWLEGLAKMVPEVEGLLGG